MPRHEAFAHLHTHMEFSRFDGMTKLTEALTFAAENGQPGQAITDHGNLAGALEYQQIASAINAETIAARSVATAMKQGQDPQESDLDTLKLSGKDEQELVEHRPKIIQLASRGLVKAVQGIEAYLAYGSRHDPHSIEILDDDAETDADMEADSSGTKTKRYMHLTLLARNRTGWHNLVRLNNAAQHTPVHGYPAADFDLLTQCGDGLIVLTGCLSGPVAGPLSQSAVWAQRAENGVGDTDKAAEMAAQCRDQAYANVETMIAAVGRDNVVVELMNHGVSAEGRVAGLLVEVADHFDLPCVVTNDCHYAHEDDAAPHSGFLLLSSKLTDPVTKKKRARTIHDKGNFTFNGSGYYLKTRDEMLQARPDSVDQDRWESAVDYSAQLVEDIDADVIPTGMDLLPAFSLPDGFDTSAQYLHHLVKQGLIEHFGGSRPPQQVLDRVSFEMQVITDKHFEDYFLMVWEVMAFARSRNIAHGFGRGSGAGSYVAYMLKITGVDPLTYDLRFERFLDYTRNDFPDFDLDFEAGRHSEILEHLREVYGNENVVQLGTRQVYLSKAAIKAADRVTATAERARAHPGMAQKLTDAVPTHQGKPMKLPVLFGAAADSPETGKFHELLNDYGEHGEDLMRYARRFEGIVAGFSTHACGVLISSQPMTDLLPLIRKPGSKGLTGQQAMVSAWDGPTCEQMGFIKLDVLRIVNLDISTKALENVKETTGEQLTIHDLPDPDSAQDPETDEVTARRIANAYSVIAQGKTSSLFQLGSEGMREYAMGVGAQSLMQISALLAMYRPGPISTGMLDSYVRRSKGDEEVSYDEYTTDPDEQKVIAEALGSTFGTLIFQEQLMDLGRRMAGFDAKWVNKLRKAVSKKNEAAMREVGARFIDGCTRELIDEDGALLSPSFSQATAETMWQKMKGSGEYLFNASHSTAYAMLTFVNAYEKANWPAEYGAAVLSTLPSTKTAERNASILSLRAEGVSVLAPDVNRSFAETVVVDGAVLLGLAGIKDVGAGSEPIISERENNGPFTSLADLMQRVPGITTTVVGALICSGALDSMCPSRMGLMMGLRASGFGVVEGADWDPVERSLRQRAALGVAISDSPLELMADRLLEFRTGESYDDYTGRRIGGKHPKPLHEITVRSGAPVFTYGVVVAVAERAMRKRRGSFLTLTLEGFQGTMDVTVWESAYKDAKRADPEHGGRNHVPEVGDVLFLQGLVSVSEREMLVRDEETGEEAYEMRTERKLTADKITKFFPDEHGYKFRCPQPDPGPSLRVLESLWDGTPDPWGPGGGGGDDNGDDDGSPDTEEGQEPESVWDATTEPSTWPEPATASASSQDDELEVGEAFDFDDDDGEDTSSSPKEGSQFVVVELTSEGSPYHALPPLLYGQGSLRALVSDRIKACQPKGSGARGRGANLTMRIYSREFDWNGARAMYRKLDTTGVPLEVVGLGEGSEAFSRRELTDLAEELARAHAEGDFDELDGKDWTPVAEIMQSRAHRKAGVIDLARRRRVA